jgi:hypothetical protein
MIFGSAALGGLGSKLAGGDFFKGFAIGLAVGAFNHALDKASRGGKANVYIEKDGVGHVFIEVEDVVYSYGRYNGSYSPSSGSLGPLGDGVLLRLEGTDAQNYINDRMTNYPTEKFTVSVNTTKVISYLDKIYNSGTKLSNTKGYFKNARVVDTYNLVGPCGNNCATMSYKALNYGGAEIRPAQTPAGMLFDFRQINYINQGYQPNKRTWGPK